MLSLKELRTDQIMELINTSFAQADQFNSVEDAAQHLSRTFYETFQSDSQSEIVLSRVFHSFEYQLLPENIKEIAQDIVGEVPGDDYKFLALLGTFGDQDDWKDRAHSQGHKAIPLTRESIAKIPMIARLFQQVGFNLDILLGDDPTGIDISGIEKSFSVFHVPNALDSKYIPAQDFVMENQVKSVIGTGVMLPKGDIGIYIAFSRVFIDEKIAPNIAPLMSLFWQKIYSIADKGFFN